MSNSVDPSSAGLSSVDNALRILVLLSARPTLRVADAAAELGIARSTAHRLLATLKKHDFAAQERGNAAYRIGPALTKIGLVANERLDIRRAAGPMLEWLRQETGETVSLSVLEGQNVRFVECREGTRAVRVGDRTGLVLPASSTAGGKALLAAFPVEDLERRFPEDLPVLTEATPSTRERLREELAAARRDGFAVNLEESENGICAVAVTVCDPAGTPLGAIALVVPSNRFDRAAAARWAPVLFEAVRNVEEALARV